MFSTKTDTELAHNLKEIANSKSEIPIDLDKGTTRIPNITTPSSIVNKMLDMIPAELWNDETVFLDPACKDGRFLRIIYDRLRTDKDILAKYDNNEDKLKFHILSRQLHGFALNQTSKAATIEMLDGFDYNIKVIPNYIEKLKCYGLSKIIQEELGENMEFDVVIGNPPYQDSDGRSSVYPIFIKGGMEITDTVCMVTRDNWLNGMAFEQLREEMCKDGGIVEITHYPIVGELFNTVGVAVAYFLWQRGYQGHTLYNHIEHNELLISREVDIKQLIVSDIAASIVNKINVNGEWAREYNSRSYAFMDQRKRYNLDTSYTKDNYYNVAVMINNGFIPTYTSISNFQNTDEVLKYKVLCGVVANESLSSKPENVLTNIKAIAPMEVASKTWSLIATFNTKEEAINCKKYIQTKFFRFLANQTVNNRSNVTKNTFKYAPLQNFHNLTNQTIPEHHRIDWLQSLTNIDHQLYAKYNLSEEEINYIESTIKSMDTNTVN